MKSGIMQHDTRDCGAACLATIFLRYKLKVPLVQIREKMAVNRNGASVYAIIKTAEEYNLNGNGLYGNWEDLNSEIKGNFIKFPFIAHVVTDDTQLHYIVIDKIDAKSVKGFDPAKGRFNYTISQFCNLWTGYLIAFNKNTNFRSGNLKKGQYKKYVDI